MIRKGIILLFLFSFYSCFQTPEPVDINPGNLISTVDVCCYSKLGEGKVFDTLQVSYGIYGFCSTFCKKKFIEKKPKACRIFTKGE